VNNLSVTKTKKSKSKSKSKSKLIKNDIEEKINDEELTRLDKLKPGRRNFS
tara:strand:- start:1387 stop:1539 length:153 start_codon:yes stop_codon:yes gene_type:complete